MDTQEKEENIVMQRGRDEEEIKEEEGNERHGSRRLKSRKLVHQYPFDVEAGEVGGNGSIQSHRGIDWPNLLKLAFQSIGVVYGDIGTSPLYTLAGIFSNGIKDNDDLLGAFSLIFYSITLITLIKYAFIVLSANDDGEGGTFALYSLICRHAKASLIPAQQIEDKDISNYKLEVPNKRLHRASKVKSLLEKSHFAKMVLLLITMLGTSMVIGDGILTPCISVISAVQGIKEVGASITDTTIMWISVAILFLLFQFQKLGTEKVGYSFAPILMIWFLLNAGIGVHNFVKYDPSVIKGINPMYIVEYFKRNKKDAWISLGGVILCLTGSEALFADLGHFSVRSIRLSTYFVVYPSILFAYLGQVSYLRKHNLHVSSTFYKSIPDALFWPMFVVAVMAAIIASQSLISASFSIIQQSLALGCFPRVKVVHTSSKYEGQVYIPEVNYLLMVACIGVTLGFKNTTHIGNAYGFAVVFVMTLTSALLVLVMIMIWKTNIFLIMIYIATIYLTELLFLSSVLFKFKDGGYLPIVFATILMGIMCTWNYVYRKRYMYELENKVEVENLKSIASDPNIRRVPGVALFYSDLVHGISPIFTHYVANVPALHSILIFVTIKAVPISKVPIGERFFFRRVQPHDLYIFQCVVRYGYKDVQKEWESCFGETLIERLKDFIGEDRNKDCESFTVLPSSNKVEETERELKFIDEEYKRGGITYLVGENEVVASRGSNMGKIIMINYSYHWLKKIIRQKEEVFNIPHKHLLKVGMTYEL